MLALERMMTKISHWLRPSSILARIESPGRISHSEYHASTPLERRSVANFSTNTASPVAWLMKAFGLACPGLSDITPHRQDPSDGRPTGLPPISMANVLQGAPARRCSVG